MSPRNRTPALRFACAVLALCALVLAHSSQAQEKPSSLKDSNDGKLDMSEWLLERNGFLPVPIIITEPAVDMGFGLAVAFFHKPKGDPGDRPARPSITGVGGLLTGNDSWMAGIGHLGFYKQDTIRYTSFSGGTSLNLDFYVRDKPFAYSIDGLFLLRELKFRLGQSNFFLGGRLTYLDAEGSPLRQS
jgi:hypothetical protein